MIDVRKFKSVYSQLKQLVKVYEDLYKPVQKFIDEHELIKNKYKLNFNVSIAETDFIGKFFNYINQGTRGTFYGAQDGKKNSPTACQSLQFKRRLYHPLGPWAE